MIMSRKILYSSELHKVGTDDALRLAHLLIYLWKESIVLMLIESLFSFMPLHREHHHSCCTIRWTLNSFCMPVSMDDECKDVWSWERETNDFPKTHQTVSQGSADQICVNQVTEDDVNLQRHVCSIITQSDSPQTLHVLLSSSPRVSFF